MLTYEMIIVHIVMTNCTALFIFMYVSAVYSCLPHHNGPRVGLQLRKHSRVHFREGPGLLIRVERKEFHQGRLQLKQSTASNRNNNYFKLYVKSECLFASIASLT